MKTLFTTSTPTVILWRTPFGLRSGGSWATTRLFLWNNCHVNLINRLRLIFNYFKLSNIWNDHTLILMWAADEIFFEWKILAAMSKNYKKKNQQLQTKPVKNVRFETEKKPCIFGRFYCDEQHLAFIIREK